VAFHLRGDDLSRERVLAAAVRLLDVASFRIGGEEYAEENETYGLASLRRRHVRVDGATMVFDFPAKLGVRRLAQVEDRPAAEVFAALKARRGGKALLAFSSEGRWRTLRSDDVNAYLKELVGEQFSAKDFRTWNATVLAAVQLARIDPVPASDRARRRVVTGAIAQVAEYLGNTVAVCRSSYIDPRLLETFERSQGFALRSALQGKRTRRGREVAVLSILRGKPAPGRQSGVRTGPERAPDRSRRAA
jgi:DNA topoisomerase IB